MGGNKEALYRKAGLTPLKPLHCGNDISGIGNSGVMCNHPSVFHLAVGGWRRSKDAM